jgi:hypothetical protein
MSHPRLMSVCRTPDRSSVCGLAAPRLREHRIDELRLNVHVHEEQP